MKHFGLKNITYDMSHDCFRIAELTEIYLLRFHTIGFKNLKFKYLC